MTIKTAAKAIEPILLDMNWAARYEEEPGLLGEWSEKIAAAAVEADRAQRAENTLTIHLDEEFGPVSAMREVRHWLARGDYTSGYEPQWELHDGYDRKMGQE